MRLFPVILFSFSLAGQPIPVVGEMPVGAAPVGDAKNTGPAVPAASGLLGRDDRGRENAGRAFYRWSVVAVVAANAADAVSSWNTQEANPFVAGPGTQFGVASLAIKSGFVVTSLLIQRVALRHRPDWRKRMAWMNVITAGVLGQVARHNLSVR